MSWKKQSEKLYVNVGELQKKVRDIDRLEKSELSPVVIEAIAFYKAKLTRDINSCIEYKREITKKGR